MAEPLLYQAPRLQGLRRTLAQTRMPPAPSGLRHTGALTIMEEADILQNPRFISWRLNFFRTLRVVESEEVCDG